MQIQKGTLAAAIILSTATAFAAENYTTPINDARQAQVTILVQAQNVAVYRRAQTVNPGAGITLSSTQAQVCTALSVPGGASCTAGQARTASARIYPQTTVGREEYWNTYLLVQAFPDADQLTKQAARYLWRDWWTSVANQTSKDSECTNAGMSAGCDLSN